MISKVSEIRLFGNLKASGGKIWQGVLCHSDPETNSYLRVTGPPVT
jgi:hypothetical protein